MATKPLVQVMDTMSVFPIGDQRDYRWAVRRYGLPLNAIGTGSIKAQWTGERRPVKAGEWYLSGAIVEAYRAPYDVRTEHYIARLVRTEMREVVTGAIEGQL